MLRQAGVFRANQNVAERVMDSNPLERERGITILSKNASVRWEDTKINIVDTPGHADFGGEVERILRMVDGFLLLVDAAEGPMPQTRFVAGKALALGLKPIVIVNKIDRQRCRAAARARRSARAAARSRGDARAVQLSVPVRLEPPGIATRDLGESGHRPAPACSRRSSRPRRLRPATRPGPSRCSFPRSTTRPISDGSGSAASSGAVHSVGETVALLPLGEPGPVFEGLYEQAKVAKLFAFEGVDRVEVEVAEAGEIVALAGSTGWRSARRSPRPITPERLAGIAVEEPTISVDMHGQQFSVRRAGREVRHRAPAAGTAVPRGGAQRGPARRGRRTLRTPSRCRAAASCTSAS